MKKKMSRTKQIDTILFRAEACYPSDFDPDMIALWHESLAEYDVDQISAAFTIHIKTSRFLPAISEIIDILKKSKVPQFSIQARAQEQWRTVLEALSNRGYYKTPPFFSDPVTAILIKNQFTWPYLCSMLDENLNWEEKRWCQAFELAAEYHKDLPLIDSPEIRHIVDMATREVTETKTDEPETSHGVPVDKIKEFRKILRDRVLNQDERLIRAAELREQALKIESEEI